MTPGPAPGEGPQTRAAWAAAMCGAASLANCGHCWTPPGTPCARTGTASGYHPARFTRASRAGIITGPELAALTAGLIPGALIWDTPEALRTSLPDPGPDTRTWPPHAASDHHDPARKAIQR